MKLTLKVEIDINDDKLNDWKQDYLNELLCSSNIEREEARKKVEKGIPFSNDVMSALSDAVLTISCKYEPITKASVSLEE